MTFQTGVTTQTRFALVLNGGVSLAVWMGGATHEVNRMRMASAGILPNTNADAEHPVHEAWRAILEATKRTALVDVFAGTSAGGLNGTLLATAVANGTDLPDMRETWSTVASLSEGRLLRPVGEGPLGSILDGTYFADEVTSLLEGFSGMSQVMTPQDCTLLVTATALDAQPVPVNLEGDSTISQVDSRRVYRFERRTNDLGIVQDQDFLNVEDLSRAARASASFPAAFEPVAESEGMRARRVSSREPPVSWLIDGGVLDNAPFGPLIEALEERPINAQFERVVLYITPSPGYVASGPLATTPTITDTLTRLYGAIREPDQRQDVESLQSAFSLMGFTRSAPHEHLRRLLRSVDPYYLTRDEATRAAALYFPAYRETRAEAVERWLVSLDATPSLAVPQPPSLGLDDIATVPEALALGTDGWDWGIATAERAARWWGRMLSGLAASGTTVPPDAFSQVDHLQRAVARWRSELMTLMEADPPASSAQARALRLTEFFTEQGMSAQIRDLMDVTASVVAQLAPPEAPLDGPALLNLTLAVEVISSVLAWGWSSEGDTPTFRYGQVTPARTSIDLPFLDQESDRDYLQAMDYWPSRKLYGERWGHFGAFASTDARQADWLWGRLDGANALCDHLLTSAEGEPLLPDASQALTLKTNLFEAILTAEGTTEADQVEAARTALNMRAGELFANIEIEERSLALHHLWAQVRSVLDQAQQSKASKPIAFFRAFVDPMWTTGDNPSTLSRAARLGVRLTRWAGLPGRLVVRLIARRAGLIP